MKILRLDLLAFGPFSGECLPLHMGQHGFHLVYGPNEAGKSTSLRAIRQFLYGIPHTSSDHFVHSHPNLRIGGVLESAQGERLELIRRKARNKSLRGPDDADEFDPSRLADLLGGVDDATFGQRFGLDYEELRKGGKAVVNGGGELGGILFAAGAGVANLGFIQKRLDEEAECLFKPRGSLQRINKALSDLVTAQRAIKDAQLPTTDWVKLDKDLRTAEEHQAKLDSRLLETRSLQSRLTRIARALPLVGRRSRLVNQLAGVADARLLPEGFPADRRAAQTALMAAEDNERDALNAIKTLNEAIATLSVPIGLLEHRTAITRLHTELGSYEKATRDRPGLLDQLSRVERQGEAILQRLGRPPELQQADQLRLTRAQRQLIQTLAADCKARVDHQNICEQSVRKLSAQIQQLDSIAAGTTPGDTEDLHRVIRRARKHGDLDQQLATAQTALQRAESAAEVALSQLRLWKGALEDLERLSVPTLATVDRFESELAAAAAQLKIHDDRLVEFTRKAQVLDQKLERLRLEHDVPTEADLVEARQRRETGWRLVQQAWQAGLSLEAKPVVAFIDAWSPGRDLTQAYQTCVEVADALVDRIRRESDRVAEKAQLTTDRRDLEDQLANQEKEIKSAQAALDDVQSQWRRSWAEINIEPLTPREMRSWLQQQRSLAEGAAVIRSHRDQVAELESLVRSRRQEVHHCLTQLDPGALRESASLEELLNEAETTLTRFDAARQHRDSALTNLQTLRGQFTEAEQNAAKAKSDMEQWRIDWAGAVAGLGLTHEAGPPEANAVIEAIDELLGLLKEASTLRGRIDGIDRDANDFRQAVQRLLAQVAEDLAQLPVDQAVADLYDRLASASTAQTTLNGWNEQLLIENAKRDRAHATVLRCQASLSDLCQQAGCSTEDGLPAAEVRSLERQKTENELADVNQQLDELAGGSPLAELITAAEAIDSDQLQAELRKLEGEIAQLEIEKTAIAELIGSHRNELRRMDGSARAAELQDHAEQLLAGIRNDAEQYIRLKLASTVLRRSIERFRESSQGPVLARASSLFAELTLGSFVGLRADYDDHGRAVLVGIRAGQRQVVGVEGMSTGTCDQLYLALRLALLESYLSGREPLPFIIDDLLVMFDDERVIAALQVLARLSEKTQVIYFTHHEHVVHLARQHLPSEILFTHTLNRAASGNRTGSVAEV